MEVRRMLEFTSGNLAEAGLEAHLYKMTGKEAVITEAIFTDELKPLTHYPGRHTLRLSCSNL